LKRMPRSGNWLHAVKFITAVLLLMVVLFISQPYHVPYLAGVVAAQQWLLVVLAVLAVAGGYFSYHFSNGLLKIVSSIVLAGSVFYVVLQPYPTSQAQSGGLQWLSSVEQGLETAKRESTVTMVDLFADWCLACKEIEKKTFSDAKVQSRLRKFALVRVDFTLSDENTDKITQQYDVKGLPSLLFLDTNGKEIPHSRIVEFIGPEEFLKRLDRIAGR
jgi:thiol:disulfide interchange protein DsbD